MLGYDYEDVMSQLNQETSTIFNSATQDTINEAIAQLSEQIVRDPNFIKRLSDDLSLRLKAPTPEEQQKDAEISEGFGDQITEDESGGLSITTPKKEA